MPDSDSTRPSPRYRSPLLAFVSGFVDAAVFVHMGGLFVAHVTGNFVLIGATLGGLASVGHGNATTLQLISFPVFFLGAFLAAKLSRRFHGSAATRPLLGLTSMILAIGSTFALVMPEAPEIAAMGFAFAMGVLNAAHRLDAALGPPFTVMTGNVTAIAVHIAGASPEAASKGAARLAVLVIAFALGCVAGALADQVVGMSAMFVAAVLIAVASVRWT
jgi:uncharacterized membrane protein YoaK (UPF0700 family)